MATNKELMEKAVRLQYKLTELETTHEMAKRSIKGVQEAFPEILASAKEGATNAELLLKCVRAMAKVPGGANFYNELMQVFRNRIQADTSVTQ